MRRLPLPFLAVVLALRLALPAFAATTDELGHGLKYFRPAALADITSAAVAPPALVLDLRGVSSADAPSAAAALAALRARPADRGVCLVLISPATAPALLAALSPTPPGCVTVGRAAGDCRPDIAVATDDAAEQRALVALAAGTPPTALLGTPIAGKPRHDEAELAKDHAAGKKPTDTASDLVPKPAAPAMADAPKSQTASPTDTTLPPPPLVDAVLQRAAQLHRGLLALGKI
jgi:hypothetical protein